MNTILKIQNIDLDDGSDSVGKTLLRILTIMPITWSKLKAGYSDRCKMLITDLDSENSGETKFEGHKNKL